MHRTDRFRHMQTVLVVALLSAVTGCRPDGPERYQVKGTVTYGGQPVLAGRVIFEPDASAGHRGPAGYADIVQGEYATLPGKGAIGGPHKVRVICLTGEAAGGELADGGMLCPEYRETIDLPTGDAEHNIEVPSSLTWQP